MQRVGSVVSTAQGLLVVRCPDEQVPEIGATVVDESLDEIGSVVEIFGPVDRPYVAVTPNDDVATALLLDSPVYAR